MESFKYLNGIVASIPQVNIDTDAIIPKQFLKTIERSGLGKHLFYEKRYDKDGKLNKDFILNKAPWIKSSVLVAGDNFGCGSSREHAPWALLDFGIKCIISTSFADIFYNNCFKNGVLPIVVDEKVRNEITLYAFEGAEISINLEEQNIIIENKIYNFDIEPFRKECLLKGLDDIGLTLENENLIERYENEFNKKIWNIPNKIELEE